MMNKVRIAFFASLKELAGVPQLELHLPVGATVLDVKTCLVERFPALQGAMSTALFAVDHEFANDEALIPAQAEIAVFPPVAGGEGSLPTICAITFDPFDLDSLLAQITLPTSGAACCFTGMVRARTSQPEPYETDHLEYEAYKPMAEEKLNQIAQEMRQRWPAVEGVVIIQRVGRLDPGTPVVVVACTASHRDSGVFEAARYGIDRLKQIVPIWKKEVGPQGSVWVEGEYLPKPGE